MTFDDVEEIDVDFDDGIFVIIRKNGAINGPYDLVAESDLYNRLFDHRDEVPIYALSTTDEDENGNKYDRI